MEKQPIEGTLVDKAYEIDFNRIEEGYLASEVMCYAGNYNQARNILLIKVRYEDWKLKRTGAELTYLNIPVVRNKFYDKIIFEGKPVSRYEIDNILSERLRIAKLDEILNNPNVKYCYIYKNGYYRPNSSGYTSYKHEAGVYPKEMAVNEAKSVRDIILEVCDIDNHNWIVSRKILELESRLINN